MEFWADVPLLLGGNEIEVVARNADGVEGRSTVTVRRVEAAPKAAHAPGLSLTDLLKLLDAGVTPVRLEMIVKEHGVSFALTEDKEQALRQAGATDTLLLAITKAKK